MEELKCPKCQEIFVIDENSYADILRQVHDKDFEKQLNKRVAELEKEKARELELVKKEKTTELELVKKEISGVAEREKITAAAEIEKLKAEIKQLQTNNELDLEKAVRETEKERDELKRQLETVKNENKQALEMMMLKAETEHKEFLAVKESQIQQLQAQLDKADVDRKLALSEAVSKLEKERDKLVTDLKQKEMAQELAEKALKEKYEVQLKDRTEEIERLKDFKARLSTKMLGETLEQHCAIEFERVRPLGFPKAKFGKDNDASAGSKGDFIFRDFDENDLEVVSIMFEMKNEADTTATKHKNEHFFKELDKDRREKGCEYAVLVSMLELDNELYNGGIVDVSHQYEKMYVVRPQFFIPLITLLRNAALKSMAYKAELELVKAQNIDVTNFEDQLNDFKAAFADRYRLASDRFNEAIKQIDRAIADLTKTRDALLKSENHLRIANDKAEQVSVKRLTRNNPTMKQMFNDLGKGK